jgi:hypothetical protein
VKAADYPYPQDEFDSAAASGGPRGVHRKPLSTWRRWTGFIVVLIVFPALAYAAVTLAASWDGFPGSDAPTGTVTQEGPGDTTGATEPTESTPPTAEETPAETPTPEVPAADLTRSVVVENATNTSGLAAGAAGTLEDAGFTAVDTGNWDGDSPAASTVYYPAPADQGTAQAVAAALGIATVQESADVAGDVVRVVLADDFAG